MTANTPCDAAPSAQGFQAGLLKVLPEAVAARGLAPEPVWAALALRPDQGQADSNRVPIARLCRALATAVDLTGDPAIVLQAAQSVRPMHLGSLGYALLSSPAGGAGLEVFSRFQTLLCDQMLVQHRVSKGLIDIRHETVDCPLPRDALFWWFLLGSRLAFARWVSGRDLVPVRVDIPAPRPLCADRFDHFTGITVRYDTPDCRELMPADWLDWLNPNADPEMHTLMQTRTAHLLATQPGGDGLLTRARAVLSKLLQSGGDVSLAALAQALNTAAVPSDAHPPTSPRQLQKRLAEQGLGFKDLVEELRRERALQRLRDTQEPIASVAQACGYTEVSPFHRAVKRWTGLTPAQVRQQAMTQHR